MFLSAQISLYPLGQSDLYPAVSNAINVLREHGLEVSPGAMSSVVSGDDEDLFTAIKDVFQRSSEQGQIVMVVTLSNACSVSR
jgi:uncharacterized protein YqgV (UPF0045/DUF77 family)